MIISILMIVSLGGMTALGSYMVSKDVQLTAEDTNYSINKRIALSSESMLETVYHDSLMLLNNLSELNGINLLEKMQSDSVDYFYKYNEAIGAIFVLGNIGAAATGTQDADMPDGSADRQLFVNKQFMVANRLTASRIGEYLNTQTEAVSLARDGEILLLNVTPFFGVEMLEMIFPWKNGGADSAAGVFFFLGSLRDTFSDRVNHSFIINGSGDVLVDPDGEIVKAGANMRNQLFIKAILEGSEQNMQAAYKDEAGNDNFVAFQRMSLGNAVVITVIPAKAVFEGVNAATLRNIYLSATILILAIIFILFFSRSLSKSLKGLTKAAGMIEEGEYHINLETKRKDEIGVLTHSFMSMSRGLANFENTVGAAQLTALQRRVSQLEAENASLQRSNAETDNNLQSQNANNTCS